MKLEMMGSIKLKLKNTILKYFNKYCPVLNAKLRYKVVLKENLNLKDPKTINEKILWLSLFSDTSRWSELSDKYAVRKYVEEKVSKDILVDLYGKWENVEDIDWKSLPNSFVLKSNNASGTVKIVKDKSKLNIEETKEILHKWLTNKYSSTTTEFHYKKIKPCIIAEQLLVEDNPDISQSLIDYKIWCFNGKAYSIFVCTNRNKGHVELALFDRNWNYQPENSVFTDHYRKCKVLPSKPDKLEEMLAIAESLSLGFPEVRIDMYYVNNKIYFGEMTFTSACGTMNYFTRKYLLELGELVDLSLVCKR